MTRKNLTPPATLACLRPWLFVLAAALLGLGGCAVTPQPRSIASDADFAPLHALMASERVGDARYQFLTSRDYFAVDLSLRYRLEQIDELPNALAKRQALADILAQASATAIRAVALQLERLPGEALQKYRQTHLPQAADNSAVMAVYGEQAEQALRAEQTHLASLKDVKALDAYAARFSADLQASILNRGRLRRMLATAPAVPFIKGWITYHEVTDYRGAYPVEFGQSEVYSPATTLGTPAGVSAEDWRLLSHFAPNIVHEIDPSADYPVADDRFGRLALEGSHLESAMPVVDTSRPTVYAYVQRRTMQGRPVRQLVYTFWHPAHPKLSRFDPEAGIVDGWTVRITLDSANRPIDFESVSNCGCYYKNFPTAELEQQAANAHLLPLEGKQFHVENVVDGAFDAVVPEIVSGVDANRAHDTWLYYDAGHHQLISVRSSATRAAEGIVTAERSYTLRPYDDLESLSFHGRRASLFDPEGLVRNAHRPECKLLMPSGLYHAGHARQRETQMIYFDEATFDDPALLETYLRLPPNAFGAAR